MNNNSISTENFIKTIFKFESMDGFDTRSGTIARELGVTHAAATDMARKLAIKKLIAYEKYKELRLTDSGRKLAMDVLRKHRLWETFLQKVLGLGMHEIHQEAELLEHATSDFLLEKINDFLNYPKYDPHGDPIPNAHGYFEETNDYLSLYTATPNAVLKIMRLSSSDEEFFEFCNENKLHIGSLLIIRKHYPKNKMTEIEIDGTRLLLNNELSSSIYVKPNNA